MPDYLGEFMILRLQTLAALVFVLSTQISLAQSSPENNQGTPQTNAQFPIGPNASLTPGSLCSQPTETRYPEKIAYCARSVDGNTKRDIIHRYDVKFGYSIESMDRQQFKIDHYIPLCAGGSNNTNNLWPQNVSVYTITDPLEALVCEKMSTGALLQKDAVAAVREGKANLSEVPAILAHLQAL